MQASNDRGVGKYAIFSQQVAISRKRCKIGPELLLMTNRKSHMCFRLVPKSSTLDDLETAISSNFLGILCYFALYKNAIRNAGSACYYARLLRAYLSVR